MYIIGTFIIAAIAAWGVVSLLADYKDYAEFMRDKQDALKSNKQKKNEQEKKKD